MLISFTGAQSTGKSTLLNRLVHDSKYRKCTFIKEVTRKVAAKNIKINEHGDDITQLMILNEHLNNHVLTGCVVLDRCILDGLIYTEWLYNQGNVSEWVYDYARNMHRLLVNKLDVIFYTDPSDVKLVDDGERSVDEQFRQDIIDAYDQYFRTNLHIKARTVTLSGDVETRYKTIQQTFKNYEQVR